jgi:hypothetical protein
MAKPAKANSSSLYVECGENVPGTGFLDVEGDLLGSSLWNLNKFHSSADARNPLKLLQTPISGITTPQVCHGALFSTSCWGVEDLYLLSLNFLHIGAPKTWYTVPAKHADSFEKAVQDKARPSAAFASRRQCSFVACCLLRCHDDPWCSSSMLALEKKKTCS